MLSSAVSVRSGSYFYLSTVVVVSDIDGNTACCFRFLALMIVKRHLQLNSFSTAHTHGITYTRRFYVSLMVDIMFE